MYTGYGHDMTRIADMSFCSKLRTRSRQMENVLYYRGIL